ncbi:MAG TPA: hypothetical protein VMI31_14740 [Fimbriimonadaceae bacterium]|nr:hypothetical protein [Fimbriimonadaceae bacterium]
MKGDLRRRVLWGFAILAIVCICGFGSFGYYAYQATFGKAARSLPNEIALARKEGIPLDPDDLRPKPPIPDEENAATIYLAFFPRIDRAFREHRKLLDECNDLAKYKASGAEARDIRLAIGEIHESLEEIAAGSKRPFCDFHYRYEDGPDLKMPEMATAKNAARLLDASATFLARQGKVSEAYDEIAAAIAVGRQIGKGPYLIACLVQLAIDGMAVQELCDLIDLSKSDPALLAKAQKTLDGAGPIADLRSSFGSEVVMGRVAIHRVHTFSDLRAISSASGGDDDSDNSLNGGGPKLPPSLTQAFEARYLATWREAFEKLPADPTDWLDAYHVLKPIDARVDSDRSLENTMNAILFPSLENVALAIGHQDANRRIAACAVRLMQDRLRTGSLPATLPDYGKISIDPFDGKPLRYRREGAGFTLYSIDRDFKDDGGRPWRVNGDGGDLVREFK